MGDILIGISSPAFSLSPFLDTLDSLSHMFELWEIVVEGEHSVKKISKAFLNVTGSYDMVFQAHAPLSDINIASLNPDIRDISIKHIISTIKFANEVGIRIVTIHPGHLSPLGVLCKDRVVEINKDALKTIDTITQEWDVEVAVENMPKAWNTICHSGEELIEAIEGTSLGICFDIGHANTADTIDSFLACSDRIINIHAHDNTGNLDSHFIIGRGNIDFKSVFSGLGYYDCSIVIESRGLKSGIASINYLEKLLREI